MNMTKQNIRDLGYNLLIAVLGFALIQVVALLFF